MKKLYVFAVAILMLGAAACSSSTGSDTDVPSTPEELIQGAWVVTSAQIDGQVIPVSVPGFGSIKANFEGNRFEYIYPMLNSQGQPIAINDTLTGSWEFNDDHTLITVTPDGDEVEPMVWDVLSLTLGTLSTRYEEMNPSNPAETSEYLINYGLSAN